MSELSEEEIMQYLNIYIEVTEKQIKNGDLWLIEEEKREQLKAIKGLLDLYNKQKQQIQDLENTIDRILDEQTEREKYTYELEEKVKEHHILTNAIKETNRQIIFKGD